MKKEVSQQRKSRTSLHFPKQKQKERQEFISLASHKLKNTLTVISAFNQLLLQKSASGKDTFSRQYLKKIQTQLNSLNEDIENLADILKLEGGEYTLSKEVFSLDSLLKDLVMIIKKDYPGYKISTEEKVEAYLHADRSKISQVLTILLINAITRSRQDKKIFVRLKLNKKWVHVAVTDSGPSFPMSQKQILEDRSLAFKKEVDRYGLGAQLYIANLIAHLHKGKISVLPKEGDRTSFTLFLPFVQHENK